MKYQEAKKRVEAIKGLYIRLIVYVVINLRLFSINMIASADGPGLFWPVTTGLGAAIVLHALWGFAGSLGSN